MRKSPTGLVPILCCSIAYSNATADLRRALQSIGVNPAGVTDKSIKMAGVTAAFHSGASETEVMHLGRWRTPAIPLRYKINSFAFKKRIAQKVPDLDPNNNTDA
jgi:hypothetical protein